MILEIATLRIKITPAYTYNLTSDFMKRIFSLYTAKKSGGSFDFEIQLVEKMDRPSAVHAMESRGDTRYFENEELFIFETESWASTIFWKRKLMTTVFFQYEDNGLVERLFLRNLKLLVSLLILKKGGLPFHCSAVSPPDNKYGILFSGPPGSGKTKMAVTFQLKKRWHVFNDEFNGILPCDNHYFVYSTPFTTPEKFVHCSSGKTPVKKIYFLQEAPVTETGTLSLQQKYFSVLGGIYTFPTSENFSIIIMERAEDFARKIPIEMLYINNKNSNPDKLIKLTQQKQVTMVKVSDSVSVRKIEDEVFIFDRKSSTIHTLNKVGSYIWELLTENVPAEKITGKICSRFDIDEKTAERDKVEFIKELKEKKLLEIEP